MQNPIILNEDDVIRYHKPNASDKLGSGLLSVNELIDSMNISAVDESCVIEGVLERLENLRSGGYSCDYRLHKITEFIQEIFKKVEKTKGYINNIDELEFSILQANGEQGWQKGTIQLCLAFIPEIPEAPAVKVPQETLASSPLDEIRQMSIEHN
jgi:hypothetical protein